MRCLLNLTVAFAAAGFLLGCEAPSDSGQTAQNAAPKTRSMPPSDFSSGGGGGNASPGGGQGGGGGGPGGKGGTLGTVTSPGGGLAPPDSGNSLAPPSGNAGGGAPGGGAPGGGAPGGGKAGITGGGGGGKGGITGGGDSAGGALGPPGAPGAGAPTFDPDAGQGAGGGQAGGGKGGLTGGAPGGGGSPAGGPPGAPGGGAPTGGPPAGPGAGPPGRPGQGGNFPGNEGVDANAEAEPASLRDKAMDAFRNGNEDDAFQYMYAYYLTDSKASDEIAMGFLPAVEEPRAAVRWGVSLTYVAPRNFEGAPPRIGAEPDTASRNDRGGPGGAPGGRPGAGPPTGGIGGGGGGSAPSDPKQKISYYLGEFGEIALERLSDRRTHNGGFYGPFLASVEDNAGDGGGFAQGGGFNPRPGGGINPGGGGGSGKGGLAGGASSPQGGPPTGGAPTGGPPSGFNPPSGGGRPTTPRSNDADSDSVTGQLLPGVMFLGEGKESEMLDRARNHGIDALLHFTVKVTVAPRTNIEKTEARVELYNVKTGKSIYVQRRPLTNFSVWNDREKHNDAEPIQEELDKVFAENADEVFRLQDMPQLSAEDVKTRIDVLTSSKPENPLVALSEIKFYYDEKLIDETAAIEACSKLIGDKAEDLLNGSQEEKEEALAKWMPGNFDTVDGDDEFR